MQLSDIERCHVGIKAREVTTEHGTAIVLTGKGAKAVALVLNRENYYNGTVDTLWGEVRHGLGYAIPMYDNPISKIL